VCAACAGSDTAFAVGEDGELFSWGNGTNGRSAHGDEWHQLSPKRVEALRGVRVSSVACAWYHALALSEDGLVYAWGENTDRWLLGYPLVQRELLPRPIEALRGMRVGSVAATFDRSYAVADTGELWAWGVDSKSHTPLGHGESKDCPPPKPVKALRGIKVDAVAAGDDHTLALADDGSVYAWGTKEAAKSGALGLGPSVRDLKKVVRTPQRNPALRCACGL
jgi:alpha-tubulin suppressor-like RCC1 family protein